MNQKIHIYNAIFLTMMYKMYLKLFKNSTATVKFRGKNERNVQHQSPRRLAEANRKTNVEHSLEPSFSIGVFKLNSAFSTSQSEILLPKTTAR